MAKLPFDIPPSLYSYLEQYESDPEKTTTRLTKQLQKRGADAVGHFLLAWFYYQQEKQSEAVEAALKAKIYAPGSPFFEKLHYFFSHPKLFDAWCTAEMPNEFVSGAYGFSKSGPILDLDMLIEKLSDVESNRVKFNPDVSTDEDRSVTEDSENVDDIVSETLAKIHEQQGKLEAAISAYQKLKINKEEKRAFYDEQIERLEKKLKEESK